MAVIFGEQISSDVDRLILGDVDGDPAKGRTPIGFIVIVACLGAQ